MSFGHAWARERLISDQAWKRARLAAHLAFDSLTERALWGPQESGRAPLWEGAQRPNVASLGVWLSVNTPPALAGLSGDLSSDVAIEALPGADAWMSYPARLDRLAPGGLASTGAKLHDLVIIAALCAIEAEDPGALWIRHTDGDSAHWSGSLSWLRALPGIPRLHLPRGAPGSAPGLALMEKERAELEATVAEGGSDGKKRAGGRARKA